VKSKVQQLKLFYFSLFICIGLTGCASNKYFQDGKQALENGQFVTGIQLLKQATEQQPENNEYKQYYFRQKEDWVVRILREAESDKINENWDMAAEKYKQVLEVEENNPRALGGLNQLETAKRSSQMLIEANALLGKEELGTAQETLKKLLVADPNNNKAKKLLAQVQYQVIQSNRSFGSIRSKFKKPVSLEFKAAPIKSVFELLSKNAGVNFILDKEVKNDTSVSIFVKNTTIDEALNNILSTTQLNKKILNESSVLIYPNSKKGDYEELVAKTFYLHSAEPKRVQELIKAIVGSKDVFVDENLKMLVVKDSSKAIDTISKLIQAYDLDDPEVLLEVEILEISADKLNEIGIRFPSQLTFGVIGAGGTAGKLTLNEAKSFNSSLVQVGITDPALIINLRGTAGSSNVLANPHIRVRNHKKAKIHIGDRVPVITNTATSTGFVSESVNYLDVGLKLDVEPTILVDDNVGIDVALEVSNIVNEVVSRSGSLSYRIGTRNASTSLKLKNGETQILAGLISREERSSADRVPGLADLPVIGRLFSSKRETRSKTEIVLLITPKIVRNINIPDPINTEFSMGTETGNMPAMMGSSPLTFNPVAISNGESANYDQSPPVSPSSDIPSNPVPLQPVPLNIPPPPPLPNSGGGQINSGP
jgi:general secretion pathway protein D